MMKRNLIGAFLLLPLMTSQPLAWAVEADPMQPPHPIHVYVENNEIVSDTTPVLVNGRTMLPIRAIAEDLAAKITWSDNDTLTIQRESNHIALTIGSTKAIVNGKEVSLDTPAILYNNRTMVPVRFVGENLNCDVQWDEQAWNVMIKRKLKASSGADDQQKAVVPGKSLGSSNKAGLTPDQKQRADRLISLFENNTLELQYGYAEHLHDGRGITCGRAGFTTGTGDAYEVVKRYTEQMPDNRLAKYLPELKRLLTAEDKDDVSGLDGFIEAWGSLADNERFRSVQDEVVDELYYNPSVQYADRLNLKTPLARAVIYDTMIQHGGGDAPDGLPALIERANSVTGGSPKQSNDEKGWLNTFLDVRRHDLEHPANSSTQEEWAKSVGRIDVFRTIASSGNYELKGPIVIETEDYQVTIP